MERYGKSKNYGTLFSFFLLLLGICFTGRSEAGVSLKGYADKNPDLDAAVTIAAADGVTETANDTTYEYVFFGRYPQRQVGGLWPAQPVVWRVLSADQGGSTRKALLLSEKNLDAKAFDTRNFAPGASDGTSFFDSGVVWNNYNNNYGYSQIRGFLVGNAKDAGTTVGGVFGNAGYFTVEERGAVSADSIVSRGDNTANNTTIIAPHVTTADPLFLLSEGDVERDKYFGNGSVSAANRKARNTAYPNNTNGSVYTENKFYWWLTRSPASNSFDARSVHNDGQLSNNLVLNSEVTVRPALFLNLESFIFKSASSPSDSVGAAGSRQNAYLAYLPATAAVNLTPAVTVNGNKLTLAFTPPAAEYPGIFHAYADTADTTVLLGQFTLTNAAASGISFSGNSISFTLDKTYTHGDTSPMPTVAYAGSAATDGVGFVDAGIIPTTLAAFAAVTATNVTPQPVEPPDPPVEPSTLTTPSNVGVTLSGVTHPAQIQADGTYLITLPAGTSLNSLTLDMTLPSGATISPSLANPFDFISENPRKFTITAEDRITKQEIGIKIATEQVNPDPTESAILTVNGSDCAVVYTLNADGSVSVEIQIPFASGVTPSDLENLTISIKSSGLSDIKFATVNADGTVVPYASGIRAAGTTKTPYLQITGTAPSVASLANEALTSISYTTKGSTIQFVQTFPNGGLKLSGMNATDNTKPEPEPEPKTGGGCDAGFGFGGMGLLFGGAALLRRKQQQCK